MLNSTAIEGLKRFLQHAETLNPNNNPRRENGFAKEFQEIKDLTSRLKKDPNFSTKHGEKEVNRVKNRYKDILPYDYTRIVLPEINGVDGSDYINGNYIKGPTNKVVYLTAQGPLPCTVDDFWRMIISHKIQVIVMACREYELGKLKCKKYWPENMDETLEFAGCKISLVSQEKMGDGFIIRTLSARSSKVELKVTQFHYTAWPDHDVPRSATPLIELTISFRAFVGSDNKVPVLVHCSAGCGRTGTICALDYARTLIQMGRTETFSVFQIVSDLRKQRIAMVQTKEQYELVYKAVKELVHDELTKQRISINVDYDKNNKDDNTYENVDFIRSIQRLHQEEKNASRKPVSTPPSSSMAVVPAPRKDVVLSEKTNVFPSKKNEIQNKEMSSQVSRETSKENVVQPSTKPTKQLQTKMPSSGYENVLPLLSSKPPLAPRPAQNYVNVVIGSSSEHDDYINISSGKSVPVPAVRNETAAKSTKPVTVPDPGMSSSLSHGEQVKAVPLSTKPDLVKRQTSNKDSDYVIPPTGKKQLQGQLSSESDYVIPQDFGKVIAASRSQVVEGKLIDLEEPVLKSSPVNSAFKPKVVKQNSFDKEPKTNQESSDQQAESKTRARNSLGMVEAVAANGSSLKPTPNPRRLSEGSNVANTKTNEDEIFGVVNEKTVAKEKESSLKPQTTRPDFEKPNLVQTSKQTSRVNSPSNSSKHSAASIPKAYSTENISISNKQSSKKSGDLSQYTLVSSPYFPRKNASSSSALYSSADNEEPVKTKPTLALRRSNSGIVAPASLPLGDGDALYATVGTRAKKRPPLSTDWAANGHLPSQEKDLRRSQNSNSSLRSVTSTSSNDSSEDIPPVPVKTSNAYISPGDEDPYEAVQRSSMKSTTMDRFRAKARNMMNAGPQVPKIAMGRKSNSPAGTPRSASPVLGERSSSYVSCQLGYGKRVTKPSGPRSHPGYWPNFA